MFRFCMLTGRCCQLQYSGITGQSDSLVLGPVLLLRRLRVLLVLRSRRLRKRPLVLEAAEVTELGERAADQGEDDDL